VSNALKYTDAGGHIALRAEAEAQHVRVEVSDTGAGIPEAYRDKVFNQFFRVPNQDGVNGAGLGLAIVQQIVEAHGGSISLHSVENQGTTFTVRVPRADCAEALGLTDEVPATG
jgi:signal transduction histidine kinase